jgi:hypothetical protein
MRNVQAATRVITANSYRRGVSARNPAAAKKWGAHARRIAKRASRRIDIVERFVRYYIMDAEFVWRRLDEFDDGEQSFGLSR